MSYGSEGAYELAPKSPREEAESSRVVSLCLWGNLCKAQFEASCAVYIQFLK